MGVSRRHGRFWLPLVLSDRQDPLFDHVAEESKRAGLAPASCWTSVGCGGALPGYEAQLEEAGGHDSHVYPGIPLLDAVFSGADSDENKLVLCSLTWRVWLGPAPAQPTANPVPAGVLSARDLSNVATPYATVDVLHPALA